MNKLSKQWLIFVTNSIFAWLFLVCTTFILLPNQLVKLLGLTQFMNESNSLFGFGILISLGYAGILLTVRTIFWLQNRLNQNYELESIKRKIPVLNSTEKALLREFFLLKSPVLTFPCDEACVQMLLKHHILSQVGSEHHYAISSPTAEFKISDKARELLTSKHLQLPSKKPTSEEIESLLKKRPSFHEYITRPTKAA